MTETAIHDSSRCVFQDLGVSKPADDWKNAAEMIRAAGYVHPAEVIEEQAATIERLCETLRDVQRDIFEGADDVVWTRSGIETVVDRISAALGAQE